MPLPVPKPRALQHLQRLRTTTTTTTTTTALRGRRGRPFTTTPRACALHSEEMTEPPTGWLWGVPPGQKYKNEGWETPMLWGFGGSFLLFAIALCFKPDTSIQTWALEEARRRLEAEGILEDPNPDPVPVAEKEA